MRGRILALTVVLGLTAMTQVGPSMAAVVREHGYVTSSMQLPVTNTEVQTFARDLDGDGSRDNQLGSVYAALAQQGLDLTAAQDDAIASGEVVMLHSLRTPSLRNTRDASWQVVYGVPTPTPDLDGGGTFAVGQPRSPKLPATIKNRRVKTAAGQTPVLLDFGAGPFELGMRKAKVFATCRASACSDGRITGAVSAEELDAIFIPEMAEWIQPIINQDCPHGPDSCMADSQGKTLQGLFDTDDDMTVTTDEIRNNDLIKSLLAPDLNLSKSIPGKDALSFGFGFTAVDATLQR